jgi:CRP-like cAMP-binding protein
MATHYAGLFQLRPVADAAAPTRLHTHTHTHTSAAWPAPACLGRPRTYPPATALLRQDEPFHCLYLIEAGLVRITTHTGNGHHAFLAARRQGWLLGAVSAISGNSPLGSAVTWSECTLRSISIEAFQTLRRTDPEVGCWLQALLASEAEEQSRRTALLAGATVRERLEEVLRELLRYAGQRRSDGSVRLTAHVSVTELASLAATSREEASRLVSRFMSDGLLARDHDWLVAPARSRLLADPSHE